MYVLVEKALERVVTLVAFSAPIKIPCWKAKEASFGRGDPPSASPRRTSALIACPSITVFSQQRMLLQLHETQFEQNVSLLPKDSDEDLEWRGTPHTKTESHEDAAASQSRLKEESEARPFAAAAGPSVKVKSEASPAKGRGPGDEDMTDGGSAAAAASGAARPAINPPVNFSGRKLAFIVGSDEYGGPRQLKNAGRDTEDSYLQLIKMNWDPSLIIKKTDVHSRQAFVTQLHAFLQKLLPGDLAVFYYAGHASGTASATNDNCQLDCCGITTCKKTDHEVAKYQVKFSEISYEINRTKLWGFAMIIDGCRTPGLSSRPHGNASMIGVWRVPMAPNSMHIFACGPGATAGDGACAPGTNGVFTGWLLHYLKTHPNTDLNQILRHVCNAVEQITAHIQAPWWHQNVHHEHSSA